MNDPIQRSGLRPKFWENVPLQSLSPQEWEALCDGCGKCCLNKLEDPETGDVALTSVACRLLDNQTCRCAHYKARKQIVADCTVLTPKNISDHAYWLPQTCAYRLLWQGRPLYDWHPLISGTAQTVHDAGVSVQGWTVPEFEIDEEDWADFVVKEPT